MLSTNVKTTSDLMSIALQAEREAIRRYSQLADCMHEAENEPAAALFKRMIIEEQEHERLLLEWMEREGIEENPDIDPISWRDPLVSTTYNEEACDPYFSSPYRALAFAVHNEEIAFRFYTHVEANSENEAVRKYAEILAREELGHAALLRAERRLAYHKEHDTKLLEEPRLDPQAIHSEVDLLAAAIHIDHYLVDQMDIITKTTAELSSLDSEIQQRIIDNEEALDNKAVKDKIFPSEDTAKNLEQLKLHNAYMKQKLHNPDLGLERLWACCDRSFAFYDAIVETADNEAVMLAAQKLTSSALDRVGIVKQVLEDSESIKSGAS
ncbi:MAG: ferritin family protein [Gammaproteobacteria bacterium]|nr:ferritin family protein [Gammaproteobacteria bacterium]